MCERAVCERGAVRPRFFEETHSHCHIDQTTASHTLTHQHPPCSFSALIKAIAENLASEATMLFKIDLLLHEHQGVVNHSVANGLLEDRCRHCGCPVNVKKKDPGARNIDL